MASGSPFAAGFAEYRTFDELQLLMREEIASSKCDVVIHTAAVSDYLSQGVYAPGPGLEFNAHTGEWKGTGKLVDVHRGKVKSSHAELWLRPLVPAPKLVDQVRTPWGFGGVLVKFKLEVDVSEVELQRVAETSRLQSQADLMVANTLEGMGESGAGGCGRVSACYASRLGEREVLDRVEQFDQFTETLKPTDHVCGLISLRRCSSSRAPGPESPGTSRELNGCYCSGNCFAISATLVSKSLGSFWKPFSL